MFMKLNITLMNVYNTRNNNFTYQDDYKGFAFKQMYERLKR